MSEYAAQSTGSRAACCAASRLLLAALLAPLLLFGGEARALRSDAATSALCDRAAATAATQRGVPLPVLRALSLTETGRKLEGAHRAWPWTVNMEGQGIWFDAPDAAIEYVRRHHGRGARSFDVGCFQINYRWHGEAFPSVEAMFDPEANADYAAQFIRALYDELGDWSKAAGAYHSRSPEFAQKYRARFDRILARLGPAPDAPAAAEPEGTIAAPAARVARDGIRKRSEGEGLILLTAALPGAPGSVFATISAPSGGAAPVGLLRSARPLFD